MDTPGLLAARQWSLARRDLGAARAGLPEAALRDIVRLYTREAGVRNLEREIANILRKSGIRVSTAEALDAFGAL